MAQAGQAAGDGEPDPRCLEASVELLCCSSPLGTRSNRSKMQLHVGQGDAPAGAR